MADVDIRDMPGIKHREIKPCTKCGKGVMHSKTSMCAYTVTIQQHVLDQRAVQQTHGLELLLGSAVLANVMGPDPDIFKSLPEKKLFLCQDCFMFADVADLWELKVEEPSTPSE